MIQNQNDYIHYLNRLEAQLDHLKNIGNVRIEETLPNTFLTTPDSPSHIEYLGDFNQESISSQNFELDQY